MTTSSQALVTNLLVQKFQGLNLQATDTTGQPSAVPVYDGPEGPDQEDNYVVVMGWPGASAASADVQRWAYLGTATRYEVYDLAIMIFSWVGGGGDTSATYPNAQSAARTNAFSVQTLIEAACLADINLSVQNGGTAPIIWGLINSVQIDQTPPDEEESAEGRFCQIAMKYHVYNVLWTP